MVCVMFGARNLPVASYEADADGISNDQLIGRIVEQVAVA